MAITINWKDKIINVPRADMILVQSVPVEIRQLNINDFRMALKDLEDSAEGINFLDTHLHYPPIEVGGAILARVVAIINGYTVTFEDGQYAVNLVGSNSNIADVTNVNQVSVRSSNSAGLQDLTSLQAASFSGAGVALRASSSYSGTTFPVGTRGFPVNNIQDALSIANFRGLKQVFISEATVLDGVDVSNQYKFVGDSIYTPMYVTSGTLTGESEFINLTVSGHFDDGIFLRECIVGDVYLNDGAVYQSAVIGNIYAGGITQSTILESYSGLPDIVPPVTIDLSNAPPGFALIVRSWRGDLNIRNCSNMILADIGVIAGKLEFEPTVTAGLFSVYNGAIITDNSSGSAVINDHTVYRHTKDGVWNADVDTVTNTNSIGEKIRKNLPK